MKGKDTIRTEVWVLAVLLLVAVAATAQAAPKRSPMVLFQEALYQEETEGDLDKAIELYGQVLEQAAEVERIAARTTYQLGMCHLKKGDKDKAAEYFQEVVSYYPEQISAVRKAQAQLDKIAPTALIPSNMLPVEIMGHIIERHFQTGKKANELGIRSNTHIYGVDGFKKYSGGLLDVFNMGNDKWIDKRNIGTFTPNNNDIKLYNEQYQEQVFEWEDVEYARGKRCNLIWTPDRPVMPGEFRVLGYIYNKTPELPKTPNGYELKMQNHYGSEVLENFFLILPTTVKVVNQSHDITSHQRLAELDIYQFERHMKGENNIVTVTVDFVDLTTPNSPIVVETSPVNLTNNVPPETTEITVTFDKEMAIHSYAWCRNQHPYPEKSGQPIFSNGNFSCTLPVELKPGQYYRIGINTPPYQSFKSVDGDPAHHYVLVFATADENGQPTQIPPSLIEEVNTTNHRSFTPEELTAIVEKAVQTISTYAETDPKVKESLETLEGIDEQKVISELSDYFDSETATIRRSAIFIIWRGQFSDISATEQKLLELCTHSESLTRGMAALALGEHKIAAAYDTLVDMTLHDKDGYARRCGAYALGLLGDPKALPVLEQALLDTEDLVKSNAQAAITMLTKLNHEQIEEPEINSVRRLVEKFFKNNYRDITHRETLEWGESITDAKGNNSIRYKYEATIWDKDKIINDQIFTFDKHGKFVSVEDVVDTSSKEGIQRLVENFFKNNFRDITSRQTLEWGEPATDENGNVSIRYKYEATIRGKDKKINDQIFTFDKNGEFISVKDTDKAPKPIKTSGAETPEATILGFMQSALKFDIDKAMSYVASDSHDYNDIKEIFENPDHPFYKMFIKTDPAIPVKVTKADISDAMCEAAWEITLKEDFDMEGKLSLKAGDAFELDGTLHRYGDKWLITGI